MNKKTLIILICISIVIIISGIINGISIKEEVMSEAVPTDSIYIDGTNFTDISDAFTEIGSNFLGMIVVISSIVIVIVFWIICLIVYLVTKITKKCRKSKSKL